jgi:DNA polymerase III subunit gamma/tau
MAHQTLYRRFRPQRFGEVRGQDHLVRTLQRAVAEDRVGHAYLFSGPRGTGKTTTARLLAKALNCEHVVDGEPCGECESCVAIAEGHSMDVFEMDAASNRGIDDIRALVDRASQSTPGRRKVYILDEAHMLTKEASNALLKTLEEPPEHVVFVLATTDPQKVLPTVRSRTQHFEVHLLDPTELAALVDEVIETAGLEVDVETRRWAVQAGAGSARDTLSALERAAAMGGIPEAVSPVDAIIDGLCDGDAAAVLEAVGASIQAGRAPRSIGDDLVVRLRDVFLVAVGAAPFNLPGDVAERVTAQAGRLGARGATRALDLLGEALLGINNAPDPRVTLELAVVRIARPELDTSMASVVARLERLEQALAAGGPLPAPVDSPATHVAPVQPAGAAVSSTSSAPTAPRAAAPPSAAPPSAAPPVPTASGGRDDPASAPVADDHAAKPPDYDTPAGDNPASSARQRLAATRSPAANPGSTRRTPARPAPVVDGPPAAPVTTSSAAVNAPDAPTAVPDAPSAGAPTSDAPTPGSSLPPGSFDLETVTAAWDRQVLQSTEQKLRARFVASRVVGIDGNVIQVAVPNDRVRQRCEDVRLSAESALSGALGGAVKVRIDVDPAGAAPPTPPRGATPPPPPDDDEADLPADFAEVAQLDDAATGPDDPVDRFTEVFPGATLVEPDQGMVQ